MTHHTQGARSLRTYRLVLLLIPLGVLTAALAGTASANPSDTGPRSAMISVTFGGFNFLDDDMNDTYGMTPAVGLRLARQMDERAEFFIGLQYGKDSGNPYDTPDFRTGKETELKLVPITLGARLNATNSQRYRFHLGLALRSLWMSERGPWGSAWDDPAEPEYSGWGFGLRFLAGPEWRDPAGWIAVGFEASFGPQTAVVKRGYDDRNVDLAGTDLRFYLSGLF